MTSNYTIKCVSEAVSPITHMSGTSGNEAIVAREPVVTPGGIRYVPFLSGNALRHRCLREPGIKWLIDLYGLRGELTLGQLNFLLHGGNLTESNAHENTARIAEMKRTWPLLRLLGGSLPNQILSGSCDALRGMLVCHENARHLPSEIAPEGRLKAAESFTGNYQYTRGDGAASGLASSDGEPDSSLMIFSGQCVNRGAVFVHGFILKHVSRLEYGAALLSLALWQQSGGTIGGQAARGHGRLDTTIIGDGEDHAEAVREYVEYAEKVGPDAVAWLKAAFAPRAEKAAKKPKKGAVVDA